MSDMTLADIVRDKLERGLLPRQRTRGVVRSEGTGELCSVCELPIVASETRLTIEVLERPGFQFHYGCWDVWLACIAQHSQ